MCQVLVTSKKSAKVLCHHFNGILLCSSMFYSFLSFGMVKPNVMSDIHLFQFSGGDAKENRVGDNGLVQNLHQSTRQFGGRRENQGIKASLAWAKQLPQCHDWNRQMAWKWYIYMHTHTYVYYTYIHTYIHTYIRYVTLRYVTLRYVTLRYVTLHYITLHYITLHCMHTYIRIRKRIRIRIHIHIHIRIHLQSMDMWIIPQHSPDIPQPVIPLLGRFQT